MDQALSKAHAVQSVPKSVLHFQGVPNGFCPLNDFVLIEAETFESYDKHIGLKKIVIPERFAHGPKDRNPWGKILAMGSLCKGVVKVGDRVVWGKWAGAWMDLDQHKLALVREYDLLGVER